MRLGMSASSSGPPMPDHSALLAVLPCETKAHCTSTPHLASSTCQTTEDAKGHFCFLPFFSPSQSLMLRSAIRKIKDPITALKSSTLRQRNGYSKIKSTQKPVVVSKSVGCIHTARLQPGIKPAQHRDRILSCLSGAFQPLNFGVINISLGRCRLIDHQLKPMRP